VQQGKLKLPILTNDPDFSVVQYADDTILLLLAEMDQIMASKEVLDKFSKSTGLKINYHKSLIIPLNVSDEDSTTLTAALGCQVGSMPFPYLGLPMGTTKPSIQDLFPIVEGVERRLISTSIFLSRGARLQLITSSLSSMPIYFLLSLKLPPGLNIQLEKIIRQCLWRDNDGPKQSLSSWEMVCKPRDKGGLGIVSFNKKNDSLLLKHLDKFYNKPEVPWVQLIWFSCYTSSVPHAERLCGSF
jgi:hypothetical protein